MKQPSVQEVNKHYSGRWLWGAEEAEVQNGIPTAVNASHRRYMESLKQKGKSLTAHSKEDEGMLPSWIGIWRGGTSTCPYPAREKAVVWNVQGLKNAREFRGWADI